MTDLTRVEELLLELVTQQERLIDRIDRLEAAVTESGTVLEHAITVGVGLPISGDLLALGTRIDNVASTISYELDWTNGNSFAFQVVSQLQPHREHSFAAGTLNALAGVQASIAALG